MSSLEKLTLEDFEKLLARADGEGPGGLVSVEVARELQIPAGVVINREGSGDNQVEEFCRSKSLPILMRVPFLRSVAEGMARGLTLTDIRPEYIPILRNVYTSIRRTLNDHSDDVTQGAALGAFHASD